MTPVGFECVHCRHRLSVRADRAGEPVRCPKCQGTLVSVVGETLEQYPFVPPLAADTDSPSGLPVDPDSIFSDLNDDDSLFGGLPDARKPILPASQTDAAPPTRRLRGIPDPKAAVDPAPSEKTAHELFLGKPTLVVTPAEVPNSFRQMVDEAMSAERWPEDEDERDEEPNGDSPARTGGWRTLVVVGLAAYAVAATVAAVWGWTRTPAEKPGVLTPRK